MSPKQHIVLNQDRASTKVESWRDSNKQLWNPWFFWSSYIGQDVTANTVAYLIGTYEYLLETLCL